MSSKYLNKKVVVDGIEFASKKEAKRYIALSNDKTVTDLQLQVRYELIPAQREASTEVYKKGAKKGLPKEGKVIEQSCFYVADFVYKKDGKTIVEDIKSGYRRGGAYAVFTIKRKLMLEKYGIRVVEV